MSLSVLDASFFKGVFNPEDHVLILNLFVERHFPKGSIVFQEGDEGREMYVIKSGSLKIYKQDQGREIILGHQFPGEAIGELEVFHYDNQRLASVATLESTTLWMIRKADINRISVKYPELIRKALYIVSERLAQANRKLEYLAFLDSRVRVANLLLDLYSNFGKIKEEGLLIDWKATQQHIANMIGIGRESVARVLQEFQQESMLRIVNKNLYILDLTALQTTAGAGTSSLEGRKWHSTHKYDIPFV